MAAIIAQLSRANWERKKNRKKTIPAEKSCAVLPPFDERYIPEVHNKYLRCRIQVAARKKEEKLAFAAKVVESARHHELDDRAKTLTNRMRRIRARREAEEAEMAEAAAASKSRASMREASGGEEEEGEPMTEEDNRVTTTVVYDDGEGRGESPGWRGCLYGGGATTALDYAGAVAATFVLSLFAAVLVFLLAMVVGI